MQRANCSSVLTEKSENKDAGEGEKYCWARVRNLSSFSVVLIKNDVLLPLISTAQKPSVSQSWVSIMDRIELMCEVFTRRVCCVYVYMQTWMARVAGKRVWTYYFEGIRGHDIFIAG